MWLLALCAALIGAVIGSAINALVHRVPRGIAWGDGRSKCPKCHHALGVLDLVPVLSWCCLRGTCRYCKAPIAPRYVLVELVLALGYALAITRLAPVLALVFAAVLTLAVFFAALWGEYRLTRGEKQSTK